MFDADAIDVDDAGVVAFWVTVATVQRHALRLDDRQREAKTFEQLVELVQASLQLAGCAGAVSI